MRRATAGGLAVAAMASFMVVAMSEGAAAAPTQVTQCGTDLSTRPAAPSIAVTPNAVSATGATTVTVTGGRYLTGLYDCTKQRFGGVYLFFGWVQPGGQWGPSFRNSTSMTGHFGTTYSYPGEGGGAETRDDGSGVIRLVSFTSGGTSGSETPFHMDGDGNWSATLIVPGAMFSWKDEASGATSQVDCRQVQCGVFTIGAHGVASRPNELFTPVTFTGAPGGGTPGGGVTPTVPAGGGTTGGGGSKTTPTTKPSGSAKGGKATTTTVPVSVAPATELPAGSTTVVTAPPETTTTAAEDADESAASERAGVQIFEDEDEGGGAPVGAIAAGVGGVALLAAGATVVIRRRRT